MKIRSLVSIAQILPNLHEFQHDRFFVPATSSGPSVYPNQGFFHAPVLNCSGDAGSSGRALRREEDSLFRHREGGEADRHGYSRRDFFALCRGEPVAKAGLPFYRRPGSVCLPLASLAQYWRRLLAGAGGLRLSGEQVYDDLPFMPNVALKHLSTPCPPRAKELLRWLIMHFQHCA